MIRRRSLPRFERIALVLTALAIAAPPARPAHADPPASTAPSPAPHCREQRADPNLIRSNYIPVGGSPESERHRHELAEASIRYRTRHYGYFAPFGSPSDNPHPPSYYAQATHFMGLPITVNRAIVPALACVEREITRRCADHPYHAHQLVGLRRANSYAGHEVSNHVYGIAVDVDARRNPCCGCGTMYRDSPGCMRHAHTVWERMEMPECWVDQFERYGFYWLGHDRQLQDLMHFEFLGDPDRIVP